MSMLIIDVCILCIFYHPSQSNFKIIFFLKVYYLRVTIQYLKFSCSPVCGTVVLRLILRVMIQSLKSFLYHSLYSLSSGVVATWAQSFGPSGSAVNAGCHDGRLVKNSSLFCSWLWWLGSSKAWHIWKLLLLTCTSRRARLNWLHFMWH